MARVVALLGLRQSGKTTLARQFAASGVLPFHAALNYFEIENPTHLERLAPPKLALEKLSGLVVIDEIQHRPELFPILRVLADREEKAARFLILGSASRDLIRQGAETLARRIAFVEVTPFSLAETGPEATDTLWLRGGLPLSFLGVGSLVTAVHSCASSPKTRRKPRFLRRFPPAEAGTPNGTESRLQAARRPIAQPLRAADRHPPPRHPAPQSGQPKSCPPLHRRTAPIHGGCNPYKKQGPS